MPVERSARLGAAPSSFTSCCCPTRMGAAVVVVCATGTGWTTTLVGAGCTTVVGAGWTTVVGAVEVVSCASAGAASVASAAVMAMHAFMIVLLDDPRDCGVRPDPVQPGCPPSFARRALL